MRIHFVFFIFFIVACNSSPLSIPTATYDVSSAPQASRSPYSNDTTATPATHGGNTMENKILYYEYEYFQLEGIPPYPSPYTTIDSIDKNWVDVSNPSYFRYERHFTTREPEPRQGIETSRVGTGPSGLVEQCQVYDGKTECTQQVITPTTTYDEWFKNFTNLNTRFQANKNSPQAIGGYVYKGIQTDNDWGDVYVFERPGVVAASDLYPNYPMIETLKFEVNLGRNIEWTRTIIDGEKTIIHAYSRLVKWEIINSSDLPGDFFSPKQP